jgi:hypothetical protein
VRLHSTKIIYRHVESNFVLWLCNQLKRTNEERYRADKPDAYDVPEYMPSREDRLLISSMIYYLSPTQSIEASDLKVIGMTDSSINALYELYELFVYQNGKSSGTLERDTEQPLFTPHNCLQQLEPSQYNLLSVFFQTLQRYQSIRAMRINNANLLRRQQGALLRKHSCKSISERPVNATEVMFSPCCMHMKNTFSRRQDMFAIGTEDVYYSHIDGIYTCAKKEYRPGKRKTSSSPMDSGKLALRAEEHNLRPICAETEIIMINAIGDLIETDGCKMPNSKKGNSTGRIVQTPLSPYWITPCCGSIFGYQYFNWFPEGYACGLCSENNRISDFADLNYCSSCCAVLKKGKYYVMKLYDDVYRNRYTRVLLCLQCKTNWRFWKLSELPVSVLMKGATEENYVGEFAKYYR